MLTTAEDWGFLRAKPTLVTYLVERTPAGGRCARLTFYRALATNVLRMGERIDKLAGPRDGFPASHGLAADLSYRESQTADLIQKQDVDLRGMLEALKAADYLGEICRIYARMVLGHEDDKSNEAILVQLRQAGFDVPPAGTCH